MLSKDALDAVAYVALTGDAVVAKSAKVVRGGSLFMDKTSWGGMAMRFGCGESYELGRDAGLPYDARDDELPMVLLR